MTQLPPKTLRNSRRLMLIKLLSGEGTIATSDLFDEAVFVKAKDWQYEKEWRLVGGWDRTKEEEYIQFAPEEMTAVYLGCRISETDRAVIKKTASKKYSHAAVYMEANRRRASR